MKHIGNDTHIGFFVYDLNSGFFDIIRSVSLIVQGLHLNGNRFDPHTLRLYQGIQGLTVLGCVEIHTFLVHPTPVDGNGHRARNRPGTLIPNGSFYRKTIS